MTNNITRESPEGRHAELSTAGFEENSLTSPSPWMIGTLVSLAVMLVTATLTHRGLVNDGSEFFLRFLIAQRWLDWDLPRLHAFFVTQLPLQVLWSSGIRDISILSHGYSVGLFLPPFWVSSEVPS